MDFAIIIGIVVGFGALIGGFLLEHGVLSSLVLLSPAVIVIGGTIGATIASTTLKDLVNAFKAVGKSFKPPGDPTEIIDRVAELSEIARKDGITALEVAMSNIPMDKDEYYILKEGVILILEMKSVEQIQYILEADVHAYTIAKQIEIGVFEAAGGFSPTMGIIGTVMGLINVLSNMGSPEELTGSIAVAFVATLYGVCLANIVYIPIAHKLKNHLKRQKIIREMIIDGVCMIANGAIGRDVKNELSLYYNAFSDGNKKYKEGINN